MPRREVTREVNPIFQDQIRQQERRLDTVDQAFQPQRQALQQARRNFFRDADAEASSRGMLFSGAPVQSQARYVDEEFTPLMSELTQQEGQQRADIQANIGDLKQQRGQTILERLDARRAQQQEQSLAQDRMAQERRLARQQREHTLRAARI